MEVKRKKKLIQCDEGKEVLRKENKEIKTLYQCNTLKNFNKSKYIQKIIEEADENKNKLQSPIKQISELGNGKNKENILSLRYTINYKDLQSINDNTPLKKTFYNNSNKINNKKFPLSVKREKNISNDNIIEKPKTFMSNNKINNKNEKNNFINNLNNIVVENKKKIKQNQGKLNNLINSMNIKEDKNSQE